MVAGSVVSQRVFFHERVKQNKNNVTPSHLPAFHSLGGRGHPVPLALSHPRPRSRVEGPAGPLSRGRPFFFLPRSPRASPSLSARVPW